MTEWKLDEKLDKILNDFEIECVEEDTLDEPIVNSGKEVYTARRICDEVRKGTPFGKEYTANFQNWLEEEYPTSKQK